MNTTVELTKREMEVAELLSWGASKKEIPDLLKSRKGTPISVRTVEVIAKNIYYKLGIQKVSELCVWFFAHKGYISLDLSPLNRKIAASIFLSILIIAEVRNTCTFIRTTSCRSVRSFRVRGAKKDSDNTYNVELL